MSSNDIDLNLRLGFEEALRLKDEGNFSSALYILQELVEEYPDSAPIYGVMGGIQRKIGNSIEAAKCFRKVVELNPGSELGSLGLFHSLWEMGKTDEAFCEMKRFLSLFDSHEYRRILGEIRNELKTELR